MRRVFLLSGALVPNICCTSAPAFSSIGTLVQLTPTLGKEMERSGVGKVSGKASDKKVYKVQGLARRQGNGPHARMFLFEGHDSFQCCCCSCSHPHWWRISTFKRKGTATFPSTLVAVARSLNAAFVAYGLRHRVVESTLQGARTRYLGTVEPRD